MPLVWEHLGGDSRSADGATYRASVPGGWLVKSVHFWYRWVPQTTGAGRPDQPHQDPVPANLDSGDPSAGLGVGVGFLPDPNHKWAP